MTTVKAKNSLFPASTPAAREELEVLALWHEQVHASRAMRLVLSADGDAIYSGCDAAAPKLRDTPEPSVVVLASETGKALRSLGLPPGNIRCLVPSGDCLVCGTSDGMLACVDPSEPNLAGATSSIPGTPAGEAGNTTAASAATTAGFRTSVPSIAEQVEQGDSTTEPAALPAGPEFVAEMGYRGHKEGYLFREGTRGRGYYRKDVLLRETEAGGAVANSNSSNGQSAAAGGEQEAVAPDKDYLRRLAAAPAGMHAMLPSGDGTLLFTSSVGPADSAVRVWRMEGGLEALRPALHRTLTGHGAGVLALALSPDGSLLYSGSFDQTIRVWRTADWSCVRVLRGHGGGIRALAASPVGGLLYSAAADNTIRAWSTEHWVCLRTLHGRHEDTTWPCCMALSPDGRVLATGSNGPFGGSTIKLFQTAAGAGREAGDCLATVAHLGYDDKGDVSALAFSRDGATLYSGASDGSLAAWRLAWRAPQGAAARRGLRTGFL
eukprot:scaffold21.g2098.t1